MVLTPFAANADVLEVVAKYACATVTDALVLRVASKRWRRSVDTTLRQLVLLDQAGLRRACSAHQLQRATLRLHERGPQLDAVRIAFTCDRFPRIARLVVVAFALDGAKDELHEPEECGPRPVDCSRVAPSMDLGAISPAALAPSGVVDFGRPAFTSVETSLHQCCTNFFASSVSVTEALCDSVASQQGALRSVTRLGAHGDTPPLLLARLLTALGAQLTHLSLPTSAVAALDIHHVIERCTSLKIVGVTGMPLDGEQSAAICDALISARAPLQSVELQLDRCTGGKHGVRLLESVPTIIDARILAVEAKALSRALKQRLAVFNFEKMPGSPNVEIKRATQPWSPSARAESLYVFDSYGDVPLRIVDFAAAFPKLRYMELERMREWDQHLRAADLRFPASLTHIRLNGAVAFKFGFIAQLALHAHQLHALEHIDVDGGSDAAAVVDITPLAAFASSLRSLYLGTWGCYQPVEVVAVEDTLSRLVALESVSVPSLPSARCFMHGAHRQLRVLAVASIDEPSAGAPFHRLVDVCPRLVRATGGSSTTNPSLSEAPGWSWSPERRTALRVSFTEAATLR